MLQFEQHMLHGPVGLFISLKFHIWEKIVFYLLILVKWENCNLGWFNNVYWHWKGIKMLYWITFYVINCHLSLWLLLPTQYKVVSYLWKMYSTEKKKY
jgi:hypothetical protein